MWLWAVVIVIGVVGCSFGFFVGVVVFWLSFEVTCFVGIYAMIGFG